LAFALIGKWSIAAELWRIAMPLGDNRPPHHKQTWNKHQKRTLVFFLNLLPKAFSCVLIEIEKFLSYELVNHAF